MDCADEVAILKRELGSVLDPERELRFDILRGKMLVDVSGSGIKSSEVQNIVLRTGMRAEPWQDIQPGEADRSFWERRGRTLLTALAGTFCGAGFVYHALTAGVLAAVGSEGSGLAEAVPAPSIALYVAAIVCGGWYVAPRAWRSLARIRPDMNLLMTIAVIGAAIIGEWFEAAVVTFLFAVSLALESWSVGRARRAVDALLAIAPERARVKQSDGTTIDVPVAEVPAGARVLVKPGDRVPLDGSVVKGESAVNQAPITGESMPVEKSPGMEVFAGTINGDGALEAEVTRVAGESTLSQIIRMVSEAQSRRAESEQWVDRFARVYTPAILGIAFLVAVVPPVLLGGNGDDWVYNALVLLVIGCPCALVISTPVSIVASLASAARHGVLVKGGIFIEIPARLKAIALDKTGTLTEGAPRVVDVVPAGGHSVDEVLAALAAIESHSDHPLARAITVYVQDKAIAIPRADNVKSVTGRGMTAEIGGKKYWIGSHRYLEDLGQETSEIHAEIESRSTAGRSVVIVGKEDHVCGFVTLADAVRPESKAAVDALHDTGVDSVIMLTGDNQATASRIAQQVGIREVRAELLPADKVMAVEELVQRYGTVGMIGDGVNDAPAMGRATIGIAMGAAGSDAAIEAADIALMTDDLNKLPWLIRHSRRTLRIIWQNVAAALGVKALFVILTFVGVGTLWMAIAADMGVSLLVVANALRLLRG
jgi:Cd2+/Zn2+-exporting ATPase